MAHDNTVFSQILKLVPRHEFESLARAHHRGRAFRRASRWSQFVAMTLAQLAGRRSLRDIVDNLGAQAHRLYHLGSARLSRSNLARINDDKPYALYEALFAKLLHRCQAQAPGHGFRFRNRLYSLDASTIDVCLSVFPWAKFRATKGAVKLHVGLNHAGHLPEFVAISDGKANDIELGRALKFPVGSVVTMDRGYNDYGWYNQLNEKGIYFVTRLKSHARYRVRTRRSVSKSQGLICDQTIEFNDRQTAVKCPVALRRIAYRDPGTGHRYVFLTNHFGLAAKTIADIYKARWQVELFFKSIKQNLKIKTFVGTSKNAVLTQIWIAMCVYLLLAFLKFQSQAGKSIQQILRMLQLNLFDKRELMGLLRGDPPPNHVPPNPNQLALV